MARARSQTDAAGDLPRRKRLSLLDSYSAFGDDQLQDAAAKIRRLVDTHETDEALVDDQPAKKDSDGSSGETIGEVSGQSSGETIGEVSGTPYGTPIVQSVKSPHGSPDGPSYDSPIESPHGRWPSSPDGSPYGSPDGQLADTRHTTESSTHKHTTHVLTVNQALLYFCLERLQGTPTSLSRIAQATGVSQDTLKSCLQRLREQGLIDYGGRFNCGGRFGFTARALQQPVHIHGDRNALVDRLQQLDYHAMMLVESLADNEWDLSKDDQVAQPLNGSSIHRMVHPMEPPSCSSSFKKELLQDLQTHLILEGAFQDLNPQSLVPYLDQFGTLEALQTFLDMANACIEAAKTDERKSIKNPQGFLFAQLRAGYINPPESFKSRRVLAQEIRNQQLECELETLRALRAREQELQFEIFKERLTEAEERQLEVEVRQRVKPGIGISEKRQIAVHRDDILKEWFMQRQLSKQE